MAGAFDIVVIGSGHNGLVAAAYLAKAGKKVLVLERNAWFGGGVVTQELTVPGFHHDRHSMAHIFIQANPLIRNDELGLLSKYGLKYIYPEMPLVSVFPDGETIGLYRDRERGYRDVHVERDVLAALRAVLDGVHRGLADRRLQALQPVRRQAEVRDGGRDPVHRLALVALEAGERERG